MAGELQGLSELQNRLERMLPQVVEYVLPAFNRGLMAVVNHAKQNHPAWPTTVFNPDGSWRYHNITNNLTNSINLRMGRYTAGTIEGEVGVLQEFVRGDAMEYASKIERDHPYIGPAVEAKKEEWLSLCEQALRNFFR